MSETEHMDRQTFPLCTHFNLHCP